MSDYRRFIAYLYEYPNNRKADAAALSAWSRRTASAAWTSRSIAVASAGDLGHGLRIYPPVRADVRHSARKSPCGALFYEWKTLHALRCHWADGCHARRAWRSDPALPPDRVIATQWDDLPIQPEFFSPTLPQEPKTSADNGTRPTEEKTAETPEPLDPAVPAQSLPSSDASKAQFDELSTEFSSNSELYPQNSNPESTVSTESTSTDTVNTVPADRITQSSANTLYPASAESVKTAESYPSANPEPPQPIPDSTAQPLHMTSADFPAAAAVPPSRAALYLQLQDQFPEFHPFPDDDLTDCLRLSLDDLPQLRAAGLSVDANRFVLHGSSSYRHLLLARNRDQQELWYFGVPGVYTPNEQFMASLFGFFHFKQAMRPSELAPDARFGYWYRTL